MKNIVRISTLLPIIVIESLIITCCVHSADRMWSILDKDQSYFDMIQSDPKILVDEYCRNEFEGIQNIRVKVALLNPDIEAKEKKIAPELGDNAGKIISFQSQPLIVVESYQIKYINVAGNSAESVIIFKRLAIAEGDAFNRRYLVDKTDDQVKLTLKFNGKKWWILDPPEPRICKDTLIDNLEQIVKRMDDIINDKRISEAQKKYFIMNKQNLEFLKKL